MSDRVFSRLTPGNAVSVIVLVLALGGISYAAATLPKDSVGSKQIKKGAVKGVDVKDKTLEVEDLSNKARDTLKGAAGPQGPAGPVAQFQTATVAGTGSIAMSNPVFEPPADPPGSPGPSVTVDVPASGLVEVYASAKVNGVAGTVGGIALAVDGQPGPTNCAGLNGLLIRAVAVNNGSWATGPADPNTVGCGTSLPGLPQSLMLSVPPGPHTFKLVYAAYSTVGAATVNFSERRLSVAPRP